MSSSNSCHEGALRVVAKDPEVLLDVGGYVHHAGSYSCLHLPVSRVNTHLG